jgi:hypothetical protein
MSTRDSGLTFRRAFLLIGVGATLCLSRSVTAGLDAVEGAPAEVAVSSAPVEPAYVYHGDRLRDPFIPLTGAGRSVVMDSPAATGTFNPTNVELKGILQTRTGRWAILRSSDGGTFIVQNGKVHDSKRKPVEGYVAIVKEKAISLMGPNNQTVELSLKKEGDSLDKR